MKKKDRRNLTKLGGETEPDPLVVHGLYVRVHPRVQAPSSGANGRSRNG